MQNRNKPARLVGVLALGLCIANASHAQDNESLFGVESKGLTYGPYVRAELGLDVGLIDDGFWDPPGTSDPRVFFDLVDENAAFGSLAFGFDWMNGLRADISMAHFGAKSVSGDWSVTDPVGAGPHASVEATVSSTVVMGTVFFTPTNATEAGSAFSPYFSAGLGFARHDMDDWTRINPAATRTERVFEGATTTDLAWSVGFGVSWKLEGAGSRDIYLDVGIRYYDLGDAQGGSTPLPGHGSSTPRVPLTLGMESTVIPIGVRIPLNR